MDFVVRVLLILAVMAFFAVLPGCSDEDSGPVEPEPFQVVIEVADPDGDPVPGLELGLTPDSPFYMDGKRAAVCTEVLSDQLPYPFPSPFYGSISLPFELSERRAVLLTIENVEGGSVRMLVDGPLPAGSHVSHWGGRDDDGDRVSSGVYSAHLVLRDDDSGEVVADQSQFMLLGAFTANQYEVGTTGGDGRVVIEERQLFPYLYDLPDFPAVDENGEVMGTISLTPTIRFYLTDPIGSQTMRFDGEVTGPATLRFTWDPAP